VAATGSPAFAQTGVQFDGLNDYVSFGQADSVGVSTSTLEIWFYKQGVRVNASTGTGGVSAVPLLTKGRGEAEGNTKDMNFFLGIRGGDDDGGTKSSGVYFVKLQTTGGSVTRRAVLLK
jgi:hypothetical protein